MMTNTIVANATDLDRSEFYKKTFMHVAMAVLAFVAVESLLLKIVPESMIAWMVSGGFIWLFLIGLFWLGSAVSSRWSLSQNRTQQYIGLAFYVVLEAVIFLPMMFVAVNYAGSQVITQAAVMTFALFAALVGMAMTSNRDFSFLRSFVIMGGFLALGIIVAGALFNFNVGLWFSAGMILLASASILYQTSQLKNVYTTDQYVGAALQLFSSVMLLFWYILRIFLSRRR